MDKLLFGTAGVPHSAGNRSTKAGIGRIPELGLGCMELEFVQGVRMKEDKAHEVHKAATLAGVTLTAHGPYYINLASLEPEKIEASRERVLKTARIGKLAGAVSITFHAAFYQKRDPEKIYRIVKKELEGITEILRKEKNDIWVRPEVTGKPTQFGSLPELLQLSEEVEGVMPCIDISHMHARSAGKYNTYDEFRSVFLDLENALGRKALDFVHMHVSGIEYSAKGERKHLVMKESDFNYKDFLKALKEFEIKGCIICESPNLEEDALLLKETYEGL